MGVVESDVEWLAGWYSRQVDGEWEHEFGVTIDTLDNPGWSLRVDLAGTSLLDRPFVAEAVEGDEVWRRCWKDDVAGTFCGVGDQASLPILIARFRHWAEGS